MNEILNSLPKVLVSLSGDTIITPEQWFDNRRPELLDLFRSEIYGAAPIGRPENIRFEVGEKILMMEGKAVRKKVCISYEGSGGKGGINLILFLPSASLKPAPIFLLLNNRSVSNIDPERSVKSPFWPAEAIINRGYGAAAFSLEDADPDNYDGFKNGVHGIFDDKNSARPLNAWGTIAAWAWAASRVMDYFETDKDIDSKRVALVGHSRGGKTALWCGAQDERFSMIVSNNSGCTGAALSRGKKGETIRDINTLFPHWFCENYKGYIGREHALPVDQHMLLSLIAPRLLYVTSATEDEWADPASEFLSCTAASPAYNLLGFKGLGTQIMPSPDCPVMGERLAYHIRTGKHDLTEYDWCCFMDFADKYLV